MKSTWVDTTELWTNHGGKKSNKWGGRYLTSLPPLPRIPSAHESFVKMKRRVSILAQAPWKRFTIRLSISTLFGSPTRRRHIKTAQDNTSEHQYLTEGRNMW